jgi:hypothetical protein
MSKKARAFLWLIREATSEQADEVSGLLLADQRSRWSEFVQKNLVEYLKIRPA